MSIREHLIWDNRWNGHNGISLCNRSAKHFFKPDFEIMGSSKPMSLLGFIYGTLYIHFILFWSRTDCLKVFSYGPSLFLTFSSKIEITVCVHDTFYLEKNNGFGKSKYYIYKYIVKFLFLRYRNVFTVSGTSQRKIQSWLKNKEIPLIYNGRTKNYTNQKKRLIERPYFLFVGNSKPHKNLDRLQKAFLLSKSDVRLLVVVGILHKEIVCGDRKIQFLTGCTEDEMVNLYKYGEALLVPSLDEGYCLPAVECTLAGGTVLHSDIPVLNEILGPSIIKFNALDIQQMSSALNQSFANEITGTTLKVPVDEWSTVTNVLADQFKINTWRKS